MSVLSEAQPPDVLTSEKRIRQLERKIEEQMELLRAAADHLSWASQRVGKKQSVEGLTETVQRIRKALRP